MRLPPSVSAPLCSTYRELCSAHSVSVQSLSETRVAIPVRSGAMVQAHNFLVAEVSRRPLALYSPRLSFRRSNHDFRRVAAHARVVSALVAGLAAQSASVAQARHRIGARQYRGPTP